LTHAIRPKADHPSAVLTEIYIEDLLVDEERAVQVWAAGQIDVFIAAWA